MEYLFGLVFTLFKIAIQASLYATAIRWLARRVDAWQVNNALVRASRQGRPFWQRSFVVVYVALFLFSCTYWSNHGLEDSACIPLGHGEKMFELDGTEAHFEATTIFNPSENGALWVDKFQVADDILCAQANDHFYFTYNLAAKENRVFTDSLEYNAYAAPRGLPASSEFQSFGKHYSRYWGGWRFWLLA